MYQNVNTPDFLLKATKKMAKISQFSQINRLYFPPFCRARYKVKITRKFNNMINYSIFAG